MAKRQKLAWDSLAIWLLIILVIATNVYWWIITRDLNNRLDDHTNVLLQLLNK